MRVERVRYFEAAARLGSLRSAADEAGVSQQSLGAQIELLEEELDTVLLTRSRRGVTPTPAGEALLPAVRQLIAAEDGLRESAQDLRGDYEGVVRVGCVPALASALVGPVVARLLTNHPALRFSVVESSSRDVEEQVAAGRIDLGVVTQPVTPAPPDTQRQLLFTTGLAVCLPRAHPLTRHEELTWDDIATEPLVSMRSGTTLWDALHRNVTEPTIVFEAAAVSTVRHLVAHGAGLGIEVPLLFDAAANAAPVVRRPLRGPDTSVSFCLTHNTRTQPSRAALTVRHVIVSETARLRSEELSDVRT